MAADGASHGAPRMVRCSMAVVPARREGLPRSPREMTGRGRLPAL